MAPPAVLQVGGVAGDRLRVAGGDVDDAEHAEPERDPADDLAPGRAVGLGVAQVAPADPDQDQRHQPADLADRAGDDGVDALHQAAGQLPPDGGRDDDREPEQEQADPVAPVLGLEVAGGLARSCGRRRRRRGRCRARPRRSRGRARRTDAGPDRARSGPLRGAGRRLRALLRERERGRFFDVLRERVEGRAVVLALLREPGGEDVRVAMVTNLGHRHSSHTDHTPHAVAVSGRAGPGATSARAVRGRTAPARGGRSPR